MPAQPVSPAHPSHTLLGIGVAALLSGLTVVASGLRSPDGSPAVAASLARPALISEVTVPSLHPAAGASAALVDTTAGGLRLAAPLRPSGERVFDDGSDAPNRSATKAGTAGWTASWYATWISNETRAYLVMSSAARWAARWHRSVMAWDDTSGYGALEASRASAALGTHVPECPCG